MNVDVVLLVNPAAGRHRSATQARLIATRLHAAGLTSRVNRPSDPRALQAAAAQAAASGARAVFALGGDGTIHWAVQGLAGTSTPLGVVPLGTGNDIASAIGHDDPEARPLIDAVLAGRTRAVDLAHASLDGVERAFLGVLSTGFDSTVNERANTLRWPGGTAKYLRAMLLELPRFTARGYRVVADGVETHGPGMLVTVGNGPAFGGGMKVCPHAVMDDGLLNLTWLGEVGMVEFLRVFPRVYSGTHLTHRAVRTLEAASIAIDAPGQVAYADGERLGPLPVSIRIASRSLSILDTAPRP